MISEWKAAFARTESETERADLEEFYKNQIAVLNGAFDAVRAVDSSVDVRLDTDQIKQVIEQQSGSFSPRADTEQSEVAELAEVSVDPVAELLANQDQLIREEWQRDLESGHHDQHDLETYFAGKIDQHNTLLEMAVEAHPELQQTLPPPINYQLLKDDLQQQVANQNEQQGKAQQEVAANAFSIAVQL